MDWDQALEDRPVVTATPAKSGMDWDTALSSAPAVVEKKPTQEQPETENFYLNRLKRGLASGIGGLLDTPARAANIGVAAYGRLIAGPAGLQPPDLPFNSNAATEAGQRLLGAEQAVQPKDKGQAVMGAMVEGAGAGLTGGLPLAGALNTAKTIPRAIAQYAAQQGGIGAMAGGGAEIGQDIAGPAGGVVGGLVGGVAVPSSFLRYGGPVVGGTRAAYEAGKEIMSNGEAARRAAAAGEVARTKATPVVENIVNKQMRQSVAGTPNAAENIDEALAITAKIPGFKPSVAEMAGSEGAAQMQSRYALTTPARMNTELARMEANKKAIQDYYQKIAPLAENQSVVRNSINQSLSDAQKSAASGETAIAASLPKADQMQIGTKLTEIANAEKSAAKPAITAAYDKAFEASGNAQVSAAQIVGKVEGILGTKLVQVKPENAPQTVSAIKRILGDKTEELTGRSIAPDLMADVGTKNVTLKDLHDIRVAIGQDMASAGRSLDPTAATRMYNLGKVMPEINAAIEKLPGAEAYRAANTKFATEYAPRFKEGTNLQVFKDKSTNEPRILPDQFVSEFFKPDSSAGITRSMQFRRLFGANDEAKTLANQGIMDIYRQKVVDPQTGVINQSAHAAFLRDYGRTLTSFGSQGVPAISNINMIGQEASRARAATEKITQTAKNLKYDTVDDLVNSALREPKVMGQALVNMSKDARPQFTRAIMDKAVEGGNSSSITKFLIDNEKTLNMVPGMSARHKNDLQDIAKAYQITERAPLRGNVQSGGPDLLKNATGASTATVYAQIRATTAGRQAPITAAFNLSSVVLTKLASTKFSDVLEQALHNPDTARNLRDFLRSKNAQEANHFASGLMESMKDVGKVVWSARGPVLKQFIGLDRYPQNLARSGSAIAADLQQ